ncbi:putative nicotinamide N-methyase [Azospirillum fermentarium]|uniref:class I SAM-dependent methyltransferase n=1 Tax=Azospirillum fermentarium TaxID=1233114 RepID=UPI0022272B2E|nr:50S ribosomal protein L11 methyltransferase [Azospirillum fermentarium]MCW2248409.1 putative nicotinamide N-methyase [Azospirillum fermentarium]
MTDPSAPPVGPAEFVLRNTVLAAPSLVPEVSLHLATEVTPLWEATEATLARNNLPPPYWAFAWPGGQAVARYVLDNPEVVRGRAVLDFAAGTGVVGIAAMKAGAARALAAEIDPFALEAIRLNAAACGVELAAAGDDLVGKPLPGFDVVLAGDVCYERPMAERVTAWLRTLAAGGTLVLFGDPGRAYVPRDGIERVAVYDVPTSLELEDRTVRQTTVWKLLPA